METSETAALALGEGTTAPVEATVECPHHKSQT